MTWEEMQKNLENLKKAGKKLVGEELKPMPIKRKKLHVPGKPWVWPPSDKSTREKEVK